LEPAHEIRRFIVSNFLFGTDNGELGEDDSFLETGIVDSTGILEVVRFLEERFGVTVDDEDLIPENLDSIRNIASYLGRKMMVA
jgi:acyl carrier protein